MRHAQQQSPWHSAARATRATRPTPIVTACHCVPGTAPHARHARRSLPLRSQKSPLQAHIRKSTDSLRLPRFRNAQRAPAHAMCRTGPRNPAFLATTHASLRLPRGSTVQCLPERIHASDVPHLLRETQVAARKIMRVRDTPRTQSPRHGAASTQRHTRGTPPSTHDPCSLPRETHVDHACTKRARNPIPTAQRRGTPAACLKHARSPQPATRTRQKCARRPRTRSQCARRHSESVAPSRIPAQGHGFENLVVATPPP